MKKTQHPVAIEANIGQESTKTLIFSTHLQHQSSPLICICSWSSQLQAPHPRHRLTSVQTQARSHTYIRSDTLSHSLTHPCSLSPFPPSRSRPCRAVRAGMLLIHASSPAAALPHPPALLRRTSLAHGGAGSARCCEVGYWGKCPLHSNEERAAREQTPSKGSLFSFLGCRHMRGSGDVGEEGRSGVSQRQQWELCRTRG